MDLEGWNIYEDRKLRELTDEELLDVPLEVISARSHELTLRQVRMILESTGQLKKEE